MDLNDFWQENKRFVVTLASGAILFVIGSMVVDSFFKSELQRQERDARTHGDKLRNTAMFGSDELRRAEEQNAALTSAIDELSKAVEFRTRPRFQLDPSKGQAQNQYFATVSAVREELLRAAGPTCACPTASACRDSRPRRNSRSRRRSRRSTSSSAWCASRSTAASSASSASRSSSTPG
jgi:hypothetical protein